MAILTERDMLASSIRRIIFGICIARLSQLYVCKERLKETRTTIITRQFMPDRTQGFPKVKSFWRYIALVEHKGARRSFLEKETYGAITRGRAARRQVYGVLSVSARLAVVEWHAACGSSVNSGKGVN
jgi:hypothetical protein